MFFFGVLAGMGAQAEGRGPRSLAFICVLSGTYNFDSRAQLCNGHAELCERKYGNVTFLGSHDSFAFSGNPFACKCSNSIAMQRGMAAYNDS